MQILQSPLNYLNHAREVNQKLKPRSYNLFLCFYLDVLQLLPYLDHLVTATAVLIYTTLKYEELMDL